MKQVRELVESGKVAVISINTDYAKTEIEFQTDQSQNLFQYWDGQRSKPLRDAFGNSTLILDDHGRIVNRSSAFINQDQLIAELHASILAENSEEDQDTSFGRQ
ncbi:MAG: hypothetical protein NXI32_30580 [bacterium]|nr:hypothetical protein [bacterium]